MSSSDDGAEVLPLSVSNYHFVDDKKEIVSFAILPILWAEGMNRDDQKEEIFLDGFADNGLQKIFKQVIAWRFDLSNVNPEISVLAKEDKWMKLIKPRKSFEDVIRTILITVHCLHVVKRNPKISEKSLWDQLSRIFCLFEVRPWQNDLVDHMPLIREAVTRDNTLGKSEFLLAFIEERHGKRKLSDEDVQPTTRSEFIVDDDIADDMDVTEEDDSDENEELYDSVCAICDNGGELLCCDGKCLRSFHATVESAEDSMCDSLGFSEEVVEKIEKFYCKNCEYEQHQCFACWKLGSSAKSGAEVFSCASATCSHYYHPHCVAKLLNRGNAAAAEDLRERIVAGESFTCPVHKCCVCNEGEKKHELELQFAVCRRGSKSYHRKCLPKKIAFEDMEEEGILQRAWEGLLPNRILIYCLEHQIDEEIGTPERDHIKFPSVEDKKTTVEGKKKKQVSELLVRREKNLPKKRSLDSEDSVQGRSAVKETKRAEKEISAVRQGHIKKKSEKVSSALESLRKVKQSDASPSSSKHSKPLLVDGWRRRDLPRRPVICIDI